MRTLFTPLVLCCALGACGYRTPLALPQPGAKPPATKPAPTPVPAPAPAPYNTTPAT